MFQVRLSLLLAAWCSVVPAQLTAQSDQIAAGIQAFDAHDFVAARLHFGAALRHDPTSYEANWRLALVLIDIAKQTPDRLRSPARDSLYRDAEYYARRAVAAKPDGPDGHLALANAIGRSTLSMTARERVRRGTEVRAEALRTLELDPRNDGAWHILGRWNAEVQRLPPAERFFARTFLGGSSFGRASWDEAERDLRLAVEYAPNKIVHRFDLAEILYWRQDWLAAKLQLDILATLPIVDVSDTSYKRQSRDLLVKVLAKLQK